MWLTGAPNGHSQNQLRTQMIFKDHPVMCPWLKSSSKDSHHCCRVYKGLWGRPVPHHVEMQLLQKGPVIVRRAQSVGTLPTAIEKSNQTPNPGHCLSTAASSIITAIPTMSHPSYRKIFRCSTHPYCCYCKHSLKSFPPSLYLFIALLLRSLYHN